MGLIGKDELQRDYRLVSRLVSPHGNAVELVHRQYPPDATRLAKPYALVHETLLGNRIVLSELSRDELGELGNHIIAELLAHREGE